MTVLELGQHAKIASKQISVLGTREKNNALLRISEFLKSNSDQIIGANEIDLKNAAANGMSESMQDRLRLTNERIMAIAEAVAQVATLPDPIGEVVEGRLTPNGMRLIKQRVALGVIAIIYEARPNVTADAAALCLKSGNAVILRGGREAINSNTAIANVMREALKSIGLTPDIIQLVEDTSRESAAELMALDEYVDVLIPRGGAGLIKAVKNTASVPVIETGVGNCHIYIDRAADLKMAAEIVFNAKTSRPSVCNACETLLIHRDIFEQAYPAVKALLDTKNVLIKGDDSVCAIDSSAVPVCENDYRIEFLDYILAVHVVENIDDAIEHIARYSTGHSEAIITEDYNAAEKFVRAVDSAAVYVNASTRFTDGGEFGYGAEIGISTQKLHARGPMGLAALTTTKYIVYGNGNIR